MHASMVLLVWTSIIAKIEPYEPSSEHLSWSYACQCQGPPRDTSGESFIWYHIHRIRATSISFIFMLLLMNQNLHYRRQQCAWTLESGCYGHAGAQGCSCLAYGTCRTGISLLATHDIMETSCQWGETTVSSQSRVFYNQISAWELLTHQLGIIITRSCKHADVSVPDLPPPHWLYYYVPTVLIISMPSLRNQNSKS
jgi:hypothetical protein